MATVIRYVDDLEADLTLYGDDLRGTGVVDVRCSRPPADLDIEEWVNPPPDLFLIDYELVKPDAGGKHANYYGGTLASAIRERAKDYPVVVITRKGLRRWQDDQPLVRCFATFDGVVFKDDLSSNPVQVALSLKSIADGFRALRESDRTWEALEKLLGVKTRLEADLLKEAGPPLITVAGRSVWGVPEIARWVQHVLLRYPGILYDAVHAATLVGINEESFGRQDVQDFFGEALYTGCFADLGRRWWRDRIVGLAKRLLVDLDIEGPVNIYFAEAFRQRYGVELARSRCVHSGQEPADWVCHVLHKPVLLRYTLRYHPDQRPAVMDEARVSFKAIRESNEVDESLFDVEGQEIVRQLRRAG